MTENKRFHWDWRTGRMKDTYSSSQATKDMRLIERQINDACQSYEKQIDKLKKENEQLKRKIQRERTATQKQHQKWSKEAEQQIQTLQEENEHYKSIFFELVETALTDKHCRELYCKGILDIFDEANSLNQARDMIKEFLE